MLRNIGPGEEVLIIVRLVAGRWIGITQGKENTQEPFRTIACQTSAEGVL